MIKRAVLFLQFIIFLSFSFSQQVSLSLDGNNLNYSSTDDIGGFQIFHTGCVDGASAGDAAANGFTVSTSGTVVLAFSFSGSVIPAGEGTLVELSGDINQDCLTNFIFSNVNGQALEWEISEQSSDDGGNVEPEASCPDGTEVCLTLDNLNLNYSSTSDIAGFQFSHNGCVDGATGGDAVANGFTVSASGSTILAFSFTGSVVPAGTGTLVELSGDVSEECLSGFIFSNISGQPLEASFAVIEVLGCTDDVACNFDESANTDNGTCEYAEENFDCDGNCTANLDCNGVCAGDAVEDECGVCEGDGPQENFDCDGNCVVDIDCNGICGGSALEDECGICEGDGSSCSNNDGGCSADADVCLSLDGGSLNYSTTSDIAGFQFSHNGCVDGAAGGDATANGFTVSASGTTVLAFSFTGSVVPVGEGTLVELSGDISEECLSLFIFSDINSSSLLVEFAAESVDDGDDDGGEVSCSDGTDVCLTLDGANLDYSSTSDIAGFQFSHDGCVDGAAGGDAIANGFTVSASGTTVLAFSFTGSVVPAGEGTLVELSGDISEECLSSFIFSDINGSPLSVEFATESADDGGGEASCLEGTQVCLSLDGGDLNYSSTEDIAGFQFNHNGCITGATGGDAEANGFTVSASGSAVLAFSFTGSVVPAGDGTLVVLDGDVTEDCLSNLIFSDIQGSPLVAGFSFVEVLGCTDENACNYNENANTDDGSCDFPDVGFDCDGNCIAEIDCFGICGGGAVEDCFGECGGPAVEDECGVCDGSGPEPNFDCDGNCIVAVDCNGVCGGGAYTVPYCLDTDGDGLGNPGTEIQECIDPDYFSLGTCSDSNCESYDYNDLNNNGTFDADDEPLCWCDDLCSGFGDCCPDSCENCGYDCGREFTAGQNDLYFRTHDIDGNRIINNNTRDCNSDVCLSLDGVSLNYSSSSDIAGFQIFHDGCISNASGGDATAAGFTVSASGTVVLGFSFSGSVVAAGGGTLVLLDGEVSEDCMSDFIFSDVNGVPLTWEFDDGQPDPVYVADCSDVYPDCEFNDYDCAGVCGGSAQEDLCGECEGDNTSCTLECPIGTDVCLTLDGSNLDYSSTMDIAGFQFSHNGCVEGASGGDAEANGFSVSASGSAVLAFSFTGSVVPAGAGTLVVLDGEVDYSCLSNLIFSDVSGEPLAVSFPIPTFYGCTDDLACNYDSIANSDDGSCEYPEENFDCNGDCIEDIDCNGICGGGAIEDSCGICEGDASSCTVQLSFGVVGDSSLEILINTPVDIGGFQFAVPSLATLGDASGGYAAENDFNVSTSNPSEDMSMVLGFSFTGGIIPAGSNGVLFNVDYVCDYPGSNTVCIEDIIISDPQGGPLPSVFVGECAEVGADPVSGCIDSEACNFNPDANSDDGSCLYDDCTGECGGSAELDDCGLCEGDGESCAVYIESSVATTVDESVLEDLDSFSEDFESFVESELNLPDGSVEVTDILVSSSTRDDVEIIIDYTITLSEEELAETDFSGEDDINQALEETETAIEEDGGLPEFVYGCTDESADNYNPDANIDDGTCETDGPSVIDYCIDLHFGANLVSFYALPDDVSVGNMMSSLDGVVTGVIGEGVAASPNPVLGWVGSLSNISPTSGYWVKVSEGSQLCLNDAAPLDPASTTYDLHFGANLISFPIAGSVDLATAIPDDVEAAFTGVIGEGVAASPNPVLGWVGSLSAFEGGKGYWAKVNAAIEFEFIADETSSRLQQDYASEDFGYIQSTEQAFYFIEDIRFNDGSSIDDGDIVLAYNDNVLVGAREWAGNFTDIPAMGSDGSFSTIGYCNNNSAPEFRVIKGSTGEEFVLDVDAPEWSSNEIYQLGIINVVNEISPNSFDISSVYPNPFNPSTNIMVNIAEEKFATISIYNTNGQEVSNLWSGVLTDGSHSFTWNGADQPSGLYFARLNIDGAVSSAKLMLIK